MATLTIRNVPEEVVARIKIRAQQQGQSMEEEVRGLLRRCYQDRAALSQEVRASLGRQKRPITPAEIQAWKRFGRP